MKTFSGLAVLALFAAGSAQAASPVEGLWRTPSHNGEVQIAACGPALCGKILDLDRIKANPAQPDDANHDPALRLRPIKDLVLLQGFTGGPTEWKGGTVYNPDDGGTYKGTIKMIDADTLRLTGCIVFPLCKTQTWSRIK